MVLKWAEEIMIVWLQRWKLLEPLSSITLLEDQKNNCPKKRQASRKDYWFGKKMRLFIIDYFRSVRFSPLLHHSAATSQFGIRQQSRKMRFAQSKAKTSLVNLTFYASLEMQRNVCLCARPKLAVRSQRNFSWPCKTCPWHWSGLIHGIIQLQAPNHKSSRPTRTRTLSKIKREMPQKAVVKFFSPSQCVRMNIAGWSGCVEESSIGVFCRAIEALRWPIKKCYKSHLTKAFGRWAPFPPTRSFEAKIKVSALSYFEHEWVDTEVPPR